MALESPPISPAVRLLEDKVRNLIRRTGEAKLVETVEPALSASDLGQDVKSLGAGIVDGATPVTQRQTIFESVSRKIFYEIVSSTNIDDSQFVQIWNLLDILIVCGEQDQISLILPWYLIEELVESQTTDRCRVIFDYLESRRERLLQKDFPQTQLVVLRTCNELLRRLSRAEDAAFCGRVFFFLFQAFPLGDQSSVNLRGEYHVDNVTNFDEDLGSNAVSQEAAPAMDVENVAAETTQVEDVSTVLSVAEEGNPSDLVRAKAGENPTSAQDQEIAELYPVFWRLQQDFSLPTRLFEDENFDNFRKGLESTLAKFDKTATVVQTKSIPDEPRGVKRKQGHEAGSQYHSNYNPKYLTSPELFKLELSDLSFQRHILVQALILLDFLLSLSEAAKKRIDVASLTRVNRSVVYQYVLSDEKHKATTSMRHTIANYLQKGPDGKFYYRMVDTVLSRDKNWSQWKMAYCPPIVKDAVAPEAFLEAKSQARQATTTRRMRTKPMGAMDLSFLSRADTSKGLDGLKDRTRFAAPTLEQLVKGIGMDELDMEMANDEETQILQTKRDSKTWRALRLAARTSLGKFDRVEPGKSLQEVFLSDGGPVAGEDATDASLPEVQIPAA